MAKIITDRSLSATRWRYDIIGGKRTGPFADGNYLYSIRKKTKESNKTVRYGQYLMNGWWLPNQGYYFELETGTTPGGPVHMVDVWIPTGDYSEYYGPASSGFGTITYLLPTPAQKTNLANSLGMKVLSKVKGQKINLGVFAAERAQTIDLFTETANRIARAGRALRQKKYADAFRALACKPSEKLNASKSLANNWLQLQYGWLPLLDDAFGAAQELERTFKEKTQPKPPIFKSAAMGRIGDSDVQTGGGTLPVPTASRSFYYDARVQVYYTVDVASSHWLGRVGLTNPLDILWEKLPWSFVVDWFLPVGRFLNTLDATLGCTALGGTNSGTTYSHIRDYRRVGVTVGNNHKITFQTYGGDARLFKYERGVSSGFPLVSLPQLKNPLSAQHCANALALLRQVFRG